MQEDPKNAYRPLLQEEPPSFSDRVDHPWKVAPDFQKFNHKTFSKMGQIIFRMNKQLERQIPPASKGMLILGEAGTGKTHLLMRLAHRLGSKHHMMFIRKPNNEDAIAQHIWVNMLESLTQVIPGLDSEQTQLGSLLTHVIAEVLISELSSEKEQERDSTGQKKRWVKLLKSHPDNIFKVLGKGDARSRRMNMLRGKVLNYLSVNHPNVDQELAAVLISYCFTVTENHKRAYLQWLKGQQLEETTAKFLGLTETWMSFPPDASPKGMRQYKEEKALQAIRSIGTLATYHRPLILAFDQLEGLRNQRNLTFQWGNTLREIFTMTPNLLILTCIFPSLWKDWFQQELDGSAVDRIAEVESTLEPFRKEHTSALLEVHLKKTFEKHELPDPLYPFSPEDLEALYKDRMTPRKFLRACRELFFDEWLYTDEFPFGFDGEYTDDSEPTSELQPEKLENILTNRPLDESDDEELSEEEKLAKQKEALKRDTKATVERHLVTLQEKYVEEYLVTLPTQEDWLGKIETLVTFFLEHSSNNSLFIGRFEYNKVLPEHFVLMEEDGTPLVCIGACYYHGIAFTNRLKNILQVCPDTILMRDVRCSRRLGGKARVLLDDIKTHGEYLPVAQQEYARISSLYDCLTEVQEQNITLDDGTAIELEQFYQSLLYNDLIYQIDFFKILFRKLEQSFFEPEKEVGEEGLSNRDHLGLGAGPGEYIEQVLLALEQAQEGHHPLIPMTCEAVEKGESTNLFVLRCSQQALPSTCLEGCMIFQDAEESDEEGWMAEITKIDEVNGLIQVYVSEDGSSPTPGLCHISQFDRLSRLQQLYSEPSDLVREALPTYLLATRGGSHPKVSGAISDSESHFQPIWPFSWSLLWTPPGTRSEHHIAQQVVSTLQDEEVPERILVLAPNNTAADKLAQSIGLAIGRDAPRLNSKMLRIGKGADTSAYSAKKLQFLVLRTGTEDLVHLGQVIEQDQPQEEKDDKKAQRKAPPQLTEQMTSQALMECLDQGVKLVVMTVSDALVLSLEPQLQDLFRSGKSPFTTLLLQQAHTISRATCAVLALWASRRISLIGDPRQLSPHFELARVSHFAQSRWLKKSALEHLNATVELPNGARMLTSQHQMHAHVTEVVSPYQYGDKLLNAVHVKGSGPNATTPFSKGPRCIWYVLNSDTKNGVSIRAKKAPKGPGWVRSHTTKVLEKIERTQTRIKNREILFCSPSPAQCHLVLEEFFSTGCTWKNWEVSTVQDLGDRVVDVVFLDTVGAGRHTWSHDEWQRLINTAIGRARDAIVLLATKEEMEQPYLQPLQALLSPMYIKEKGRNSFWEKVKLGSFSSEPLDIPASSTSQSTLGHQLAMRNLLHPITSSEQERIRLLKLDGKPRLIRGANGSGKTLILAHWLVRYLQDNPDSDTHIGVFYENQLLKQALKKQIEEVWEAYTDDETPFPWEGVELWAIQDFLDEIHKDYDFRQEHDIIQEKSAQNLLSILESEEHDFETMFDIIFIDEAQDMERHTLQLLTSLVEPPDEENETNKPVMLFYDGTQSLKSQSLPNWSTVGLQMKRRTAVLRESFRSTQPIAEFALNVQYRLENKTLSAEFKDLQEQGLIESIGKKSNLWWKTHFSSVRGPMPSLHIVENKSDEITELSGMLLRLLTIEGVKASDIKILCFEKMAMGLVHRVTDALSDTGVILEKQTRDNLVEGEDKIAVCAPRDFKGQEAEVILIAGAEQYAEVEGILTRELYVSMTRARSLLAIFGTSGSEIPQRQKLFATLEDSLQRLKKPL